MDVLYCIARYSESRTGDIKKLQPPMTGLRLRCGDYRVFFTMRSQSCIVIGRVAHRRDAYR